MLPKLLHVYGPLWIHSYGVMIAMGFLVFFLLSYNHPTREKVIPGNIFINCTFIGIISGIIGGRLLFVITSWQELENNWIEAFYPWIPGFVVLGSILGIMTSVSIYIKMNRIPVLPVLDIAAIYAPLFHAIARIGCFLSGCCHGMEASKSFPLSITFTNPDSAAPLNTPLHPTQIYSSIASLIIFAIILFMVNKVKLKPGQITFTFLTLENISRFSLDFIRGDRSEFTIFNLVGNSSITLSSIQIMSVLFSIIFLASFVFVSIKNKKTQQNTT
jgi:phosphatidylglycerol---prolipoprotein diacylglyceryl transferase